VFGDAAAAPLAGHLAAGRLDWLATAPMRDELERVLAYPKLAARVAFHGHATASVLAAFDAAARLVAVGPRAPCVCKDPDDQKFIDLAVAHGGLLLSKDRAVLCMHKRLARLRVHTAACCPPLADRDFLHDLPGSVE